MTWKKKSISQKKKGLARILGYKRRMTLWRPLLYQVSQGPHLKITDFTLICEGIGQVLMKPCPYTSWLQVRKMLRIHTPLQMEISLKTVKTCQASVILSFSWNDWGLAETIGKWPHTSHGLPRKREWVWRMEVHRIKGVMRHSSKRSHEQR